MEGVGVTIGFWALAALTVISALGVMASRNLLHAVLFLILSFLGVSGFFILLSAEFLAMAQIIIYVGAIAVLVLFAVLLTPRAGRDNGETRMAAPGILLSIALAAVLIFVAYALVRRYGGPGSERLAASTLGEAMLTTWVLPFEIASVLLTAALVGSIMLVRSPEEEAQDFLV